MSGSVDCHAQSENGEMDARSAHHSLDVSFVISVSMAGGPFTAVIEFHSLGPAASAQPPPSSAGMWRRNHLHARLAQPPMSLINRPLAIFRLAARLFTFFFSADFHVSSRDLLRSA